MRSIDLKRRRFYYSKAQEEFYNKYWMGLTDESKRRSGQTGFFADKKDIFILSAVLGYKHRKRKKFKEKILLTADFREYAGLIYSIALDETKNPLVLKNENNEFEKHYIETLIEEYACGGFEYLKYELEKRGKSPLELFEELLEKESSSETTLDLEPLGPIL